MDRIRLGDTVRILKSPVAPVAEGKVGRVINIIGTHPTEPIFQVETNDGIHGLFQDELERVDSLELNEKGSKENPTYPGKLTMKVPYAKSI